MAKIRTIAEIGAKWKDVTPRRESYYKAGVEKPLRDWAEETAKAGANWKAGVDEAGEAGFVGGVGRVGTAKWKERTSTKGAVMGRWRAGVDKYADEYAKGFTPFRDVIEATDPGPRYRKGDDRNYERVRIIGEALHTKKRALRGV